MEWVYIGSLAWFPGVCGDGGREVSGLASPAVGEREIKGAGSEWEERLKGIVG